MIGNIPENSVSRISSPFVSTSSSNQTESAEPHFMDSLENAFQNALNNLDRAQIPGTNDYVYVPRPHEQTLASLNIVDVSGRI